MNDTKKILLLEDDKSSARLVTSFLESRGYEMTESHEGRDAIESALHQKPDLMIVDVLLPDMHGSEAVKQICSKDTHKDLKVLFVTSLLSNKTKPEEEVSITVSGRKYPALAKPIVPGVLEKAVSRILAGNN
ncbi:response regulator [Pelagicoccus albus]|uniref:Response regulator n=1 Tax=Pelagicoccus albus TaxID=415222 RepID=A0A7X1B577_9BACT|nr:response regulator [Pelagicoccus albus]MBC2605762.1 response regulator [Pelagicoccus albus]